MSHIPRPVRRRRAEGTHPVPVKLRLNVLPDMAWPLRLDDLAGIIFVFTPSIGHHERGCRIPF